MRQLGTLLAVAVACAAAPASAAVYLNGVNIDGVVGQRFDNCTVVIDERGNVRIEARGYAVKVDGGDGGAAAPTTGAAPSGGASGAGGQAPGNGGATAGGYATATGA